MQRIIQEAPRSTPVLAQVDVLVAGGGLSGVIAALAAARHQERWGRGSFHTVQDA